MDGMDDLVQFLRARLDEDEQAARKAAALCGCHPAAPSWTFRDGDEKTDGRILVVDEPHPTYKRRLARRWNTSYDGLFAAEHIVRHDPARVLAEVDAKRRRLARHIPERRRLALNDEDGTTSFAFLICTSCMPNRSVEIGQAVVEWPCPDLLDDAAVYADHPEHRDAWRPTGS